MIDSENVVFISWAGPRAKYIAKALHAWLQNVVQVCRPWMSDVDIGAGQRSLPEIADKLKNAQIGIIVLTPENRTGQWLHYEAGALSKTVNNSERVVPYLFELDPGDITGPLAQFQMQKTDVGGTLKLVEAVNAAVGAPLGMSQLDRIFEKWIPELQDTIGKTPARAAEGAKPTRQPGEMLEEILTISRQIARQMPYCRRELSGYRDEQTVLREDELRLWVLSRLDSLNLADAQWSITSVVDDPREFMVLVDAPTDADMVAWLDAWQATNLIDLPKEFRLVQVEFHERTVQLKARRRV